MIINREDLAWAAGLFEGEGCFCVQRAATRDPDKLYPRAVLMMTDFPVVERFAEVIGFGNLQHRGSRKANWNPQLEWHVTNFEHFQAFVCLVWPWLGQRRQSRAYGILLQCRGREWRGQR